MILSTLRAHAGPNVPIIGTNYYQPDIAQWFGDHAAAQAAADSVVEFNNSLEGLYGAAGSPVADVETAFASDGLRALPPPAGSRSGPARGLQHLHVDMDVHGAAARSGRPPPDRGVHGDRAHDRTHVARRLSRGPTDGRSVRGR